MRVQVQFSRLSEEHRIKGELCAKFGEIIFRNGEIGGGHHWINFSLGGSPFAILPNLNFESPAFYASAGLELIGKNLNFESPAFYASAGLELIGENLIFEVDLPSTQKSNAGARGNEFHDKSAPA